MGGNTRTEQPPGKMRVSAHAACQSQATKRYAPSGCAVPFFLSAFEGALMLMTRILRLMDDPAASIPVRVFMPVEGELDWSCAFSIGWPERTVKREIFGIDAIQSLDLALRMIGTELYASDYHKIGRLMWLKPGTGYGFPVPNTIRDMLVGEDRNFL